MRTLAELQSGFQEAILESNSKILLDLLDSSREDRVKLFGVYRNAYSARLIEVLESEYGKLRLWLGEDFGEMGRAYVAAHPSDVHNARWFGRHLPAFLAGRVSDTATQAAADLALLEMSLSDAFDAPDTEPLTLAELAATPPELWPDLVFSPHPSVRVVHLASNAADIWQALHDGREAPEATRLPSPVSLLVWRQAYASRFRPLAEDEAMMWHEASKGVRFGVLCEMISVYGGEDGAELRAASHLKIWLEAGMLARAH